MLPLLPSLAIIAFALAGSLPILLRGFDQLAALRRQRRTRAQRRLCIPCAEPMRLDRSGWVCASCGGAR